METRITNREVDDYIKKVDLPKTVVHVPRLPTPAESAGVAFTRPSVDVGQTERSAGFYSFQHDLPTSTVVTSPHVVFPSAVSTSTDPKQLPGPGPVVWLTEPGEYMLTATMAWSSQMQPKETAGPLMAWTATPGVSGTNQLAPVASADDIPYDLQTSMTAVVGTVVNNTMQWGADFSAVVSTPASMNSITPRAMGPITSSGASARWMPNYVTQTASTVMTVPVGSIGAARIESAASIYFSRMAIPMLYSLSIVQLSRKTPVTPTPPLSLAEVSGGKHGAFASMVSPRDLAVMFSDIAMPSPFSVEGRAGGRYRDSALRASRWGSRCGGGMGGAMPGMIAAMLADDDPPKQSTVVTTTSAAYIAPVVLLSVVTAFAAACGIMYLVQVHKQKQPSAT